MASSSAHLSRRRIAVPTIVAKLGRRQLVFEARENAMSEVIAADAMGPAPGCHPNALCSGNVSTAVLGALLSSLVAAAVDQGCAWHLLGLPAEPDSFAIRGGSVVLTGTSKGRLEAVLVSGSEPVDVPPLVCQMAHAPGFHLIATEPLSPLDDAIRCLHERPDSIMVLLEAFWRECDYLDRAWFSDSDLHCHITLDEAEDTVLVCNPSDVLDTAWRAGSQV